MSNEEQKITVTVEGGLHDMIREVAQNFADHHGVCLRSVEVEWDAAATRIEGLDRAVVAGLRIMTASGTY